MQPPFVNNEAPCDGERFEPDVHAILAQRRKIAVIWCGEDVREVRPDLSDEQAWEVLKAAKRHHDATIGINWDVLECHAQMLFGDADDADATGEE